MRLWYNSYRKHGAGAHGNEQHEEEEDDEDGSRDSGGDLPSEVEAFLPDPASDSDREGEDDQIDAEVFMNLNVEPEGEPQEPLQRKDRRKKKKGIQNPDEELVNYHIFSDDDDGLNELQLPFQQAHDIDIHGLTVTRKNKIKKSGSGQQKKPTLMWIIWQDELEKWIKENNTKDFDLDNNVVNEVAETPANMIMPLMRHQKEWLAWALKQEESQNRGGILADEMGMGKTIQAIALVLANREISRTLNEPQPSTGAPRIRGTLVICPVAALSQWKSEIERSTSKGSTKILVYHGPNRERSTKQLRDYDFVITTYSIVEGEYRKHVMPPKVICPNCEKSFNEKKKKWTMHMKKCGTNAIGTDKQSKQQGKSHLPSNKTSESSNEMIRGSSKLEKDNDTELEDVGRDKNNSVLYAVKWNRIILDEAHHIRSSHSNTTKAVFALESTYKWALCGTPVQNNIGELYSLVCFLQLVPYSYYFCEICDCRNLDHSSMSPCSICPHKYPRHFCWWKQYVEEPLRSHTKTEDRKRAMILLKHKILKNIMLRRTKMERAADLALPPQIVTLRKDTLDIEEQNYYTSLYTDGKKKIKTYLDAGMLMNNSAHIFSLITRLRKVVNHPYLVEYSATAALENSEKICGICDSPAENQVVTACEHVFCKACYDTSASWGQVSCPTCSKPLTRKTTIKGFKSSSIMNRIQLENVPTSTKIEALKEEIRFMIERDGSAKGIVFSQFIPFLELIRYFLQKMEVNCVQFDGSMDLSTRDNVVKKFNEDPNCRILLMSLKAGGVALNLTVASHAFMMDPWWNPAVERQAQGRIDRIGQYKPMRIVRFIIEGTIEEKILELQEQKERMAEGTVGGLNADLGKWDSNDMIFLLD